MSKDKQADNAEYEARDERNRGRVEKRNYRQKPNVIFHAASVLDDSGSSE